MENFDNIEYLVGTLRLVGWLGLILLLSVCADCVGRTLAGRTTVSQVARAKPLAADRSALSLN